MCVQRLYLGASPDGLVSNDSVIEVKCPYTGRHEQIVPGKHLVFLNSMQMGGNIIQSITFKYKVSCTFQRDGTGFFCSFYIQRSVCAEN